MNHGRYRPMHTELDTRMKEKEVFSQLKLGEDRYTVVRCDGRAFHTFVEDAFLRRPFDERFAKAMAYGASMMMEELRGVFAYTQSDEVSILLSKKAALYDGRAEKLASVGASIMAVNFNIAFRDLWKPPAMRPDEPTWVPPNHPPPAYFDGRTVVLDDPQDVAEYFRWRQLDARRNAVNSQVYWMLREEGKSPKAAHSIMVNKSSEELISLLPRDYDGAPLAGGPVWAVNGIGVRREVVRRTGHNPITNEDVEVERRRIVTNWQQGDVVPTVLKAIEEEEQALSKETK